MSQVGESTALTETQKETREYYIAYFDVLGYKAFFAENSNVNVLLLAIEEIVSQAKLYTVAIQELTLLSTFLQVNLQVKAFSDNFLLSIEVSDSPLEGVRLMMLLGIIAAIQRVCLQKFGLLVRGGITRGPLVITEDFIFGKGLVDVVSLEERANYPRIIVDSSINEVFEKSKAKISEEVAIFQRQEKENTEDLLEQGNNLLSRLKSVSYVANVVQSLILRDADGIDFLNCFFKKGYQDILTPEFSTRVEKFLQNFYPKEYEVAQNSSYDYSLMLEQVKEKLVEKLLFYGQYNDLKTEDVKSAEIREGVLKKYLWTMRLYNLACTSNGYSEKIIPAITNVDGRFLRMMVQMGEMPKDVNGVVKTFTIEQI